MRVVGVGVWTLCLCFYVPLKVAEFGEDYVCYRAYHGYEVEYVPRVSEVVLFCAILVIVSHHLEIYTWSHEILDYLFSQLSGIENFMISSLCLVSIVVRLTLNPNAMIFKIDSNVKSVVNMMFKYLRTLFIFSD